MQKNLKSTLYLLAVLAGVFLNSCQNNKELEETVNSVIKIDGKSLKHVNLFFMDNEKSFSCELDTPEQEKTFNALKNHFGGEISKITTKPFLLTIYTKNGLRDIKFDDIIGVSVFVKDTKSDLLQHSFFVVEKNTLKEDMRFSLQTSQVFKHNIALMGDIVFRNKSFNIATMFSKLKTSTKFSNPNTKLDMLSSVVTKYLDSSNMRPKDECSACGGGSTGCIWKDWGSAEYCADMGDPGEPDSGCKVVQVKKLSTESGLNTSEISSNEILYDFRDNFLMNYSKGRNYITYYYTLGAFMTEKSIINATNISQYLQFTTITCSIANKLKSGNNNEIIVTSSYKESALQVINGLRTQVGENVSVANILNTIEADLNLYVNKTRIEILNTLN